MTRDSFARFQHTGRARGLRLLAAAAIAWGSPLGLCAGEAASDLPTLTSIAAVRVLDREEADRGYPVRVLATVSHISVRGYTALFVDDGTAGIWVESNDAIDAHPPRFGDLVEVEATTRQMRLFAPILTAVTLTVAGQRPLPEPARPHYYEMATGHYDSLWIEVEGVVQSMRTDPNIDRLVGVIAVPGGTMEINFGDLEAESLPPLVDARVRLRGPCGSLFTANGQLVGLRVWVGREEDVTIEEAAPEDPFVLEPRSLGQVLEFSADESSGHRILVRGVVTVARPGRFLYLEDETGGLKVETSDETSVRPGESVDAVGFPTFIPGARPRLVNARFRRSGPGTLPEAKPIEAESALRWWEHDASLVRLDGQVLGTTLDATSRVLTLRVGEHVFSAEMEATKRNEVLDDILEGSDVRVTGVYAHAPGPPDSFRLHLRTPADVKVTRAASWWGLRHTLVLVGVLFLVLCAGGFWVHSMGRKNRAVEEAHAALSVTHNELEARNAELERFTYVVSHDLKSPLVTIRGFLGYMKRDARDGEFDRLDQDAERIRVATERMNQLLDDLLELSRLGRTERPHEDLCFGDVAREARAVVAGRLASIGVRVEVEPAAACRKLRGDRARLVELMQNLLDNGAKFTGEQDQPTIAIGVREGSGNEAPVFTVSDNGLGIDSAHHERIFEIFHKLDPASEGTGLGLSLVRRIVESHRGRIWVESEGHGHGSTFCFTLPAGTTAFPS